MFLMLAQPGCPGSRAIKRVCCHLFPEYIIRIVWSTVAEPDLHCLALRLSVDLTKTLCFVCL